MSQFCKLFLVQKLINFTYFRAIDPYNWLWTELKSADVISKEIRFGVFGILTFLVLFICEISVIIQLDIVVIYFLLGIEWRILLEKLATFVLVILYVIRFKYYHAWIQHI